MKNTDKMGVGGESGGKEEKKNFLFLYNVLAPWGQGATVIQSHRAAVTKTSLHIQSVRQRQLIQTLQTFRMDFNIKYNGYLGERDN